MHDIKAFNPQLLGWTDAKSSKEESENELDESYKPDFDSKIYLINEKGRPWLSKAKLLPAYSRLIHSEPAGILKRFGGAPAPLNIVGLFLNCAGNALLYHIFKEYGQKILHPNSEVVSIKALING